jgi:FkbM family methyltransferase
VVNDRERSQDHNEKASAHAAFGVQKVNELFPNIRGFLRKTAAHFRWLRFYESVSFGGEIVQVRVGSLPKAPDYDYAWQWACAQRASSVVNVGSNVGQAAFNVLLSDPTKSLVLIEANREALVVAADNLIRNGLSSNVRFVEAFLGDCMGQEIEFWTTGTGSAGSVFSSHAVTASNRGDSIHVQSVTLDWIVKRLDLSPDLLIVDVEGAETAVLRGSTRVVARFRPKILVEMHSPPEVGGMLGNATTMLRWCTESGYRAWYLKLGEELLNAEQISHRGRCHLLLQDAHEDYPEWLRGIQQGAPVKDCRADSKA